MPKYKVLKTKYTTNDTTVPETIRNSIWVGRVDDNDTLDFFDFYAEARYFADTLEREKPERKYKIVELTSNGNNVNVKVVTDDNGNQYLISTL